MSYLLLTWFLAKSLWTVYHLLLLFQSALPMCPPYYLASYLVTYAARGYIKINLTDHSQWTFVTWDKLISLRLWNNNLAWVPIVHHLDQCIMVSMTIQDHVIVYRGCKRFIHRWGYCEDHCDWGSDHQGSFVWAFVVDKYFSQCTYTTHAHCNWTHVLTAQNSVVLGVFRFYSELYSESKVKGIDAPHLGLVMNFRMPVYIKLRS